ncbi:MAG: hypothetical protein NT129_04515 [Candidatus Aenigmarchaeota archaeon]|nr:hypothetical protein [Candidatus Aenigmarchaeota archaeon]
MNGAENFIGALAEMLEAYRIITAEMFVRLKKIEEKINNLPKAVEAKGIENRENETFFNLTVKQLKERINDVETTIEEKKIEDKKKFDELYAINKSIPTGELINRIENLERILEKRKKEYEERFDELYTIRKDVDLVSSELLEVKTLARDLAKLIGKIESDNVKII